MNDRQIFSLINRRERQLLVHSYIYYELDDSIIPDDQWSKWGFELGQLRERYPDIYERSEYADAFRNFDGSTGFDLYGWYMRDNVVSRALYLLIKGIKVSREDCQSLMTLCGLYEREGEISEPWKEKITSTEIAEVLVKYKMW